MNELIVLACLLRAPAYGYALTKTAGLIFGNREMHPNIVYPSLKKFVQERWVERRSKPGERGQTRKQYRITSNGRKYILERLSTFSERDASDDGVFLFRVAFFDLLPKPTCCQILEARKLFLNSRAHELAKLSGQPQAQAFGAVALDHGRTQVEAELRWIRELERQVEAM